MIIFIYMSLLVGAGVLMRVWQIFAGEYFGQGVSFLVEDVVSLAILLFGMIAIWGYARGNAYFLRSLWKGYFVMAVLAIPISLILSPKYQQVGDEHGLGVMIGAYAMSSLLVLPAFWAWFSYAFRQHNIWDGAEINQQQA